MENLNRYVGYATILGTLIAGITLLWPYKEPTAKTEGMNSPVMIGNQNMVFYADSNDPNYANNRQAELRKLNPQEITKKFFQLYNSHQLRSACSLYKQSKCDATDGAEIEQFSREGEKQVNGYEDIKIWTSNTETISTIVCAKYKYKYKSDTNPQYIWEVMSFYIDEREDGENEITSRVCEKKFKEGIGERACPRPAAIKYCLNGAA